MDYSLSAKKDFDHNPIGFLDWSTFNSIPSYNDKKVLIG